MPFTTAARPETKRGAGRQLLGVALGVLTMPIVFVAAFTLVTDDSWTMWLFAGSGLLMILSAWRNWRMQWNGFGKLLRSLCGEWTARLLMALCGSAVIAGALLAGLSLRYG